MNNPIGELILGNLTQRPIRTVVTTLAVAVEITLVVLIVGLTTGLLQESARRVEGVGADLMVQPPKSSMFLGFTGAPMLVKIADRLEKIPGVEAVAPVLIQVNTEGGIGLIYGIDLKSFDKVSNGFIYLKGEGGPFLSDDDPTGILVDDWHAKAEGLHAGDTMELFETEFTVRGIVENGKGARLFVTLSRLQELMGAPNKASIFFVRAEHREDTEAITEEIRALLPRHKLQPIQEYMSVMTSANMPGLDTFVNSMVFLGVAVGFLVIFLSMYTGILERTRDIGILKSLGASNFNIVTIVMRETVALCLAGTFVGIALSYGAAAMIKQIFPTIAILITPAWLFKASALAIFGGIIGAVYPAWLATRQDAVAALAYE